MIILKKVLCTAFLLPSLEVRTRVLDRIGKHLGQKRVPELHPAVVPHSYDSLEDSPVDSDVPSHKLILCHSEIPLQGDVGDIDISQCVSRGLGISNSRYLECISMVRRSGTINAWG